MLYDPEGPVAKQLTPLLVREISTRYNIADDAEDVSEFINVLIGNGKTAQEICSEVKDLVDIPIDEGFVNLIFEEIKKIMQQQAQPQAVPAPAQIPVAAPVAPSKESTPMEEASQDSINVNTSLTDNYQKLAFDTGELSVAFSGASTIPAIPNKPRGQYTNDNRYNKFNNNQRGRGGINKSFNNRNGPNNQFKKSYGLQNSENFQKVLAMTTDNNTQIKQFTPKAPKGRCPDFPYCENRDCQLAHPTKNCFAYPNCPNPPGTCNYLHPDQDQELIQKLEKSQQEYKEKKRQQRQFQKPFEPVGSIGLCKFGMLCSKEICPFGHPTPANKDARVIQLEWCVNGKNCVDIQCKKAHPSPNYQAPPPEPKAKPERTLEQCKFGANCTKFNCPRRHATSIVPCREGANCQRIDCFFSHPINEDCRFGDNCTNRNCMFKHPTARVLPSNSWSKDDATTHQRTFAVPDDQVMEHAVQSAI